MFVNVNVTCTSQSRGPSQCARCRWCCRSSRSEAPEPRRTGTRRWSAGESNPNATNIRKLIKYGYCMRTNTSLLLLKTCYRKPCQWSGIQERATATQKAGPLWAGLDRAAAGRVAEWKLESHRTRGPRAPAALRIGEAASRARVATNIHQWSIKHSS